MTTLRSSCIEAMAEKLWTSVVIDPVEDSWDKLARLDPVTADMYRNWTDTALDALLTTLTEHADEWAEKTGNRYMTTAAFRADTDQEAHIHNLLAVLRGSGE